MARFMMKGLFLLVLPLIFAYSCGKPDYRSVSSTAKLEYWAPEDPWEKQKLGVCCFVYDDPQDQTQSMVAKRSGDSSTTESTPSSHAIQESKRAPAQNYKTARQHLGRNNRTHKIF